MRLAFTLTTVLLTVSPLAMVGGAVFWLWRLARRLEAATAEASTEPTALEPGP